MKKDRVYLAPFLLLLAVGTGAIVFQQRVAQHLRTEKTRLEADSLRSGRRTVDRVEARPAVTLTGDLSEANRLREELARLRQQWASATGPGEAQPLDPGMIAPEAWTNVGTGLPRSTLSTVIWATLHGRAELLGKVCAFSVVSQKELENMFANLSDEERAAYGTPERMYALLKLNSSSRGSIPPLKIITESQENGEAYLRTQVQLPSGQTHAGLTYHFSYEAGGWKLAVRDGEIDKLKATLLGLPPAQRKRFSSD